MADTRDLPLLRWGEELRRAAAGQKDGRRRRRIAMVAAVAAVLAVATAFWTPRPLLLWNLTESSPTGLYWVDTADNVQRGMFVVAWPPSAARRLGAERRYLPSNVPLVKEVAAVAGDEVCAIGEAVFVNGVLAGLRRTADGAGRPMPWWNGCHQLQSGELFLFSARQPGAFDGRYFGVTAPGEVIGRASLLWRD
jgi:conjugative transfer signal peptidase TraF